MLGLGKEEKVFRVSLRLGKRRKMFFGVSFRFGKRRKRFLEVRFRFGKKVPWGQLREFRERKNFIRLSLKHITVFSLRHQITWEKFKSDTCNWTPT